jgi:hypothetical protein
MATDRPARADEATGPADGPASPPEAPARRPPDEPSAEPRSRAELYADLRAADHAPGTLRPTDDPHTTPDGGWSWKGLRLDPPANHVADQQLAARRAAEGRQADGGYDDHGLTPALRRVEAQLDHGTLIPDTEKFALKSPARFKEKLAKLTERYPDRDVDQLAPAIHDAIRYTFIFDLPNYVEGVSAAEQKLTAQGYRLRLRKPSWEDSGYKGVNSRWQDPSGHVQFEVQFHTPESWDAKQATHDLYEKMADPRTTAPQRHLLEEAQRRISVRVTIPEGAAGIAHYRAEDANE